MKDDDDSLMFMISLNGCRRYDVYDVMMMIDWCDDEMVMSQYIDALCRRWRWSCQTESLEDETFCDTVWHYHETLWKVSQRMDKRMKRYSNFHDLTVLYSGSDTGVLFKFQMRTVA